MVVVMCYAQMKQSEFSFVHVRKIRSIQTNTEKQISLQQINL